MISTSNLGAVALDINTSVEATLSRYYETDDGRILLLWEEGDGAEGGIIDVDGPDFFNPFTSDLPEDINLTPPDGHSISRLSDFVELGSDYIGYYWTLQGSSDFQIQLFDRETLQPAGLRSYEIGRNASSVEVYKGPDAELNLVVPASSGGGYQLFNLNPDGTQQSLGYRYESEELAPDGFNGVINSWLQFMPDGRFIEFSSLDEGNRSNVPDQLSVRITDLDFGNAAASTTDVFSTWDTDVAQARRAVMHPLEDGRVVLMWMNFSDFHLYGSIYDPSTGARTPEQQFFDLNTEPDGLYSKYTITEHDNGIVSFFWFYGDAFRFDAALLDTQTGEMLRSDTALGEDYRGGLTGYSGGVIELDGRLIAWWHEEDPENNGAGNVEKHNIMGRVIWREGRGAVDEDAFVIRADVPQTGTSVVAGQSGEVIVLLPDTPFGETLGRRTMERVQIEDPDKDTGSAPEVTGFSLGERLDGTAFTYDLRAQFSDPDGDAFTLTVEGLPDGLLYNDATGLIAGTPDAGFQPGGGTSAGLASFDIEITAQDSTGRTRIVEKSLVLREDTSAPVPSISVDKTVLLENGAETGVVIRLSNPVDYDISFDWSITDASRAFEVFDFVAPQGTPRLTIEAGNTTALLRFTGVADDRLEGTETIHLAFDPVTEGQYTDAGDHVITIQDSSTPDLFANDGLLGLAAAALDQSSIAQARDYLAGLYDQGIKYVASVEKFIGGSAVATGAGATTGVGIDLADLFGITPEGQGSYEGNQTGRVSTWSSFAFDVSAQLPGPPNLDLGMAITLLPVNFEPLNADDRAELSLGYNVSVGIFGGSLRIDQNASTATGVSGYNYTLASTLPVLNAQVALNAPAPGGRIPFDAGDFATLLKFDLGPSASAGVTLGRIKNLTELNRNDLITGNVFDAYDKVKNAEEGHFSTSDGITGSPVSERITGTTQGDHITGEGGDDTLIGGGGDDLLYAGGEDIAGFVRLEGGAGNDMMVYGGAYSWHAFGGTGNDSYVIDMGRVQDAYEDQSQSGASPFVKITDTGGARDRLILVTDREINPETDMKLTMGANGSLIVSAANRNFWGTGDPLGIEVEFQSGSASQIEEIWFATANSDATLYSAYQVTDFASRTAALLQAVDDSTGRDLRGDELLASILEGGSGNDRIIGGEGNDSLHGGDGSDRLNGGGGDDLIRGGDSIDDLRDVVYAGAGHDTVDAGYGNDLVYGGDGNDSIGGGFGADRLIGQSGNDTLTGSAFGDEIFGGVGDDYINGGFGSDLINGGAGADTFFHIGVAGHGSDWIQDYASAEGDVLAFGKADATANQFQVNYTNTDGAGRADTEEAFVIYRPTGQIMWALVDGAAQDEIVLRLGDGVFDIA
ncbi:putative Ig domain-containing protein [Sulfitobacter sp. F26169L]|uniref:putative Ig domain-containing protein n=1 Tax=Sulfitobacter sp. F26169L TaxID=2996015 RepID=UPI0022608514|nr:putative Ig domain-containing protein [Sulfitobacter sp. F26169L]MCX7568003.1 putative Ig domain-containing protein [Sulfitobacter sp. F26169L]